MIDNDQSTGQIVPIKHELTATLTARYYTLGALGNDTREIWFLLHGYGQLARFFLAKFHVLAGPTRLLIAPEGLSRFYLDVPKYQRIGASWMTREDRLTDIANQHIYLQAVFDRCLSQGVPPGTRIVLLGFSQGTATAWRWACTGKVPFNHLVLWAGSIPLEAPPDGLLQNRTLDVLLGETDETIPPERARAYLDELAGIGIAPRVTWYSGGHTVPEPPLRALAERLGA